MTGKNVKALLIIDMLNDFVVKGAPLEVPGAKGIIGNIRRQINKARRNDIPIIYCCDSHLKDDREFEVWPPHAVRGSRGAEVVDELKPRPEDIVVYTKTYSSFYRTTLDKTLKRLGVRHVILTGVATNICILYTAVDAYMRGYEVSVPEDCVAAFRAEDHRFALRQINKLLKPYRSFP
ncbi:MAG: cysteine hydrolase [Candidatus Brocadiales bacterium]|nr:cysteine hydrolase [Candidatus Bathyanammoxibius amoris]